MEIAKRSINPAVPKAAYFVLNPMISETPNVISKKVAKAPKIPATEVLTKGFSVWV